MLAGHYLSWAWLWPVPLLAAWLMRWHNTLIIVNPLRALLAEARLLAAGDLTSTALVSRPGVIGQLQQAMAQLAVNLRTVVQDVRVESRDLHDALQKIAAGNRDLSQRTESTASSLEQTAASMDQLNGTVRDSAQAAQTAAEQSRHTATEQLQGITQVSEVITHLDGVTQKNAAMVEELANTASVLYTKSDALGRSMQLFRLQAGETTLAQLDAAQLRAVSRTTAPRA